MNMTIFSTLELASYMRQPFKTFQRLFEILRLLPNDGSHIYFSVNKLLKDFFNREAWGMKLIAYIEGSSYYIDIQGQDEELETIKAKHLMTGELQEDGSVKVKMA